MGGNRLEGRCFGPSPDESGTLVLLHEGLGSIDLWRDFPEKLACETGWGVFVYSRLGYGRSDPARLPRQLDYMNSEATDSLPLVLDLIGSKKIVLLGHSDGASIAAIYAGSMDDPRLNGVVLIAPHFFAEPVSIQSIGEARKAYDQGELKAKLAKYHDDVESAFLGWNRAWLDPEFMRWNIEKELTEISVPVLGLQGREDQYGTLKQMQALERGAGDRVTIEVIDTCGHSPHLEQPYISLCAIQSYLTEKIK